MKNLLKQGNYSQYGVFTEDYNIMDDEDYLIPYEEEYNVSCLKIRNYEVQKQKKKTRSKNKSMGSFEE